MTVIGHEKNFCLIQEAFCHNNPNSFPLNGKGNMATTKVLNRLRNLMKDSSRFDGKSLLAYIIPSSDAHGSEYICECDKRRQFISGFSGSAGTAVVTQDAALLWTGQLDFE
jgi:hypothetical protein